MITSISNPPSPPLPIPNLAATLRDVTTSYNFSRLPAILDHVREGGAAMMARDEGMTEESVTFVSWRLRVRAFCRRRGAARRTGR